MTRTCANVASAQ